PLAIAYGLPGGAIDGVPELLDVGMGRAPIELELLHLRIGETIGLELAPRIEAALVAEGQIARFANFPLWRFVGIRAVRDTKDFAGSDAVGLVARIVRGVEAAIAVELPTFIRDPSQAPRLDAGEVASDQYVLESSADHGATQIADNSQRLRIEAANVGVVASRHRSDRRVDILDLGVLEVLRLHPIASPPPRARSVISERAPNPIIVVAACQ